MPRPVARYCTALSVCLSVCCSFCTLYILVFSGLVPLSYCRVCVCDLTFQVSTVSWDCVFIYCVYVCIYLSTCCLFPDSRGHVMHYLFDSSPLFSPLREPIPLFLTFGVERKTVSLILYHITFFVYYLIAEEFRPILNLLDNLNIFIFLHSNLFDCVRRWTQILFKRWRRSACTRSK